MKTPGFVPPRQHSMSRPVAVAAEGISAAMQDCGCSPNNAFMQHSLLALPVIPELRISDPGLADVGRCRIADLVMESS